MVDRERRRCNSKKCRYLASVGWLFAVFRSTLNLAENENRLSLIRVIRDIENSRHQDGHGY